LYILSKKKKRERELEHFVRSPAAGKKKRRNRFLSRIISRLKKRKKNVGKKHAMCAMRPARDSRTDQEKKKEGRADIRRACPAGLEWGGKKKSNSEGKGGRRQRAAQPHALICQKAKKRQGDLLQSLTLPMKEKKACKTKKKGRHGNPLTKSRIQMFGKGGKGSGHGGRCLSYLPTALRKKNLRLQKGGEKRRRYDQ